MDNDTHAPLSLDRLRRSRDDRMLGGVCGGFAAAFKIDATLLRIAVVAATLLGLGSIVLVYLACWLIMPEEEAPNSESPGTAAAPADLSQDASNSS